MAKSTKGNASTDEQPINETTQPVLVVSANSENVDSKEKVEPSTDEQPKDSTSHDSVKAGETLSPANADITTITVETSSNQSATTHKPSHLVKFIVEYPEGYDKKKFFKNGALVSASKEVADTLVKKGIAKIIVK